MSEPMICLEDAQRLFPELKLFKATVRKINRYDDSTRTDTIPCWMAWGADGQGRCKIRIPASRSDYYRKLQVSPSDPRYKLMHAILKLKGHLSR